MIEQRTDLTGPAFVEHCRDMLSERHRLMPTVIEGPDGYHKAERRFTLFEGFHYEATYVDLDYDPDGSRGLIHRSIWKDDRLDDYYCEVLT